MSRGLPAALQQPVSAPLQLGSYLLCDTQVGKLS